MPRPSKSASQATTTASLTQVPPSQATTSATITQGRASQATPTNSITPSRATKGRSSPSAVQVRGTQVKTPALSAPRKSNQTSKGTIRKQKRPQIDDDGSSDELSTDKEILSRKTRNKRARIGEPDVPETLLHDPVLDDDQSQDSGSVFEPDAQPDRGEPNLSPLGPKSVLLYDESTQNERNGQDDGRNDRQDDSRENRRDEDDGEDGLADNGDVDSDMDDSGQRSRTGGANSIFKNIENGQSLQTTKATSKRHSRGRSEHLLSQLSDNEREQLENLAELARIYYLRYFDLEHDVLLMEVFGRRYRVSAPVIKMAKQRITANQANWKFALKEKMQNRVREIVEHDETGEILKCQEFGPLTQLFAHHYSTSACEDVFDFATKLVNIESTTRMNERHFLFFRQMWSALAAKVKLNLMWQEDEEHSLAHDENNDQMLAKWIPLMATSNEWEDIEPAHFVRMPQKKKRQKKKLNVRSPDADPSYVFLGAKFVGRNERAGEDVGRGVRPPTNDSSETMSPT